MNQISNLTSLLERYSKSWDKDSLKVEGKYL